MCNEDLIDAMKAVIAGLIKHTDELRIRFNDLEEEHREGNLDADSLGALNQMVHALERDAAAFEKILGE